MLTKRQKKVIDFIKSFTKKRGYSPSLEEIRKNLKLSSVSTIHYHIQKLERLGYLKKEENQPRSIDIYEKEQMVQIPLAGIVSASKPVEIPQQEETISIPKSRLPRNGKFYALRVDGESMIDENINDQDIVLVKKQPFAENGQKVIALIDNYDTTLKTFYKGKKGIRLQPANKKLKPIIIGKDQQIDIQGIVIDVIKNAAYPKTKANKIIGEESKRYKKLPLNKIICGDAIEELKKIPSNSCDIIIADPPYNIGKDFGNNTDKKELSEYVRWSKQWINECIRTMTPTGTMFIYGFSEILAHLSVEIPLNKRWLIWHYTNKNVASLNFWQRSHEAIICCWKNKPIFNRDEIREPYTDGFLKGAAGKVRKGTIGRFSKGGKETIYKAHENGALPRDVIKIPALAGGAGMNERWFLCKDCEEVYSPRELRKHQGHKIIKHPTQKPLELSRRLIKSCIPHKNAVILIPFVGSGSECVAAKELGASYLGFEINPDYIKIANKILAGTTCQKALSLY